MKNAARIFDFLLQATAVDERSTLITITGVTGGSPRSIGTHMAVTENGASVGSISGGCVEAAIIGEARRVIASGKAEQLRLGEGSPFIDIRLPCGGGIDILISPAPAAEALRAAGICLTRRKSVLVSQGQNGSLTAQPARGNDRTGWHSGKFQARHDPDMQLVIAGNGEEVLALARLGLAYNVGVTVFSPNDDLIETAGGLGAKAWPLRANQRSSHLMTDEHTAVVLLFHDHDWEFELLSQALEQPAFFIGAMGSRTTQAKRLRALAERGVSKSASARLVGPIGLISPARDPDTLAISAMAQIVSQYYECERRSVPGFAEISA